MTLSVEEKKKKKLKKHQGEKKHASTEVTLGVFKHSPNKGQNVVQVLYQNWFKRKQQQQHVKQEEPKHQPAQTEKQNCQSPSFQFISVTILSTLCFLSEHLCPAIQGMDSI